MDSQVNNHPSLNDVRDYIHLTEMDTLREAAAATKAQKEPTHHHHHDGGKPHKDKPAKEEKATRLPPGEENHMEMRIIG